MTDPDPVLRALTKALSDQQLYRSDHPTAVESLDRLLAALREALSDAPRVTLTFVDHRVVHDDRPVGRWTDWPVAGRLASAGVRRLSFRAGVERRELADFVAWVAEELRRQDERGRSEPPGWPHIDCGDVALSEEREADEEERSTADRPVELDVEVEVTRALFDRADRDGRVDDREARGVVHALSVVLASGTAPLVPVSMVGELDRYTTVHSLNVCLLTMAVAEQFGYSSESVYRLGVCGLLHDIGKQAIRGSILEKEGELSEEEWEEIRRHPREGARILLNSGPSLELASVVAYEHHMYGEEAGYPERVYPRRTHPASRIVQVCDIFDALRTHRPHRSALSAEEALTLLSEEAGPDGPDQAFVATLTDLLETRDPRLPSNRYVGRPTSSAGRS